MGAPAAAATTCSNYMSLPMISSTGAYTAADLNRRSVRITSSSSLGRSSRLHTVRLASKVRCSSSKGSGSKNPVAEAPPPSLSNVKESVDRSTKQELSRADIERHQEEATSEKQSILGARPTTTVPWPRPELERRPETGDRSLGSLFAVDGAAPETINGRMVS